MADEPIEALRKVWTPGKEIEEIFSELSPGSELDSIVRTLFHAVIQKVGSITVDLGSEKFPYINTGTIRWEEVHGPGPATPMRRREVTIWHVAE